MKRYLIAICAMSALAGCATDVIATSDTKPVPPDRMLTADFSQDIAGSGTAVVKRDTGVAGSACASRLSVNAKPVADIRTGERVDLHLPAGDYILSAQPTGWCGGGLREVSTTIKAGATTYFRVGYGTAGDYNLTPTAF